MRSARSSGSPGSSHSGSMSSGGSSIGGIANSSRRSRSTSSAISAPKVPIHPARAGPRAGRLRTVAQTVLHVHRAERADGLVEALRTLLAAPLDDPFAPEVVSVPTRGMERWLTQRMSARLGARPGRSDGVCANVDFPPPRRLVGDAIAAASGIEPETDPWLPDRSVWPLLDVVDESRAEPWLRTLSAHLGGPGEAADPIRRARRLSRVRHLAHLFDRY